MSYSLMPWQLPPGHLSSGQPNPNTIFIQTTAQDIGVMGSNSQFLWSCLSKSFEFVLQITSRLWKVHPMKSHLHSCQNNKLPRHLHCRLA